MTPATEVRFGGKPNLRLLLEGAEQSVDLLLSIAEGGHKLDSGLRDLVTEHSNGRVSLTVQPVSTGTHLELAAAVTSGASPLVKEPPDLALISIEADVLDASLGPIDSYLDSMRQVINQLKARGVYVFMINASTVDPTTLISNYAGLPEPYTRRAQRLDLALLRLSIDEGVSIIDVDRILAEAGAGAHVVGPVDYSPFACSLVRDEIFRVMIECGFFEPRPLMPQVGRAS